jgi:excisionase family DNA binding protein
MKYVRISEAAKILGKHPNTLRRWEKEGKLKPARTSGGHRLYRLGRERREKE